MSSNDIVSKSGNVVGQWDGRDVKELQASLVAIKRDLAKAKPRDAIDRDGIPHRDQFPEDLVGFTPYILWACDAKSVCLVGSGANRTETVASIRQHYGDETAKDALARHGN